MLYDMRPIFSILRNFAHSLAGIADKDNSLTPSLIAIPRIVLIVWEHLPSQLRTSYRLPCPCVECVEMITGSIAIKASQHPYLIRATWAREGIMSGTYCTAHNLSSSLSSSI